MKNRLSALAGRWYPASERELRESIEKYFGDAKTETMSDVCAVVVPHAGHVWSGATAAEGFKAIDVKGIRRIFILCPNHRVPVRGNVSVSAEGFETPLGVVPVDVRTVNSLVHEGFMRIDDTAHRMEHAIEIQLPFLQVLFGKAMPPMIPIIVGENSPDMVRVFGSRLRRELHRGDLLVVSSDFLHYGENYDFVPFGAPIREQIEAYDKATVEAISSLDFETFERYAQERPHCACGRNALRVMAAAFEKRGFKAEKLAYATSGMLTGDDSNSVSYVAMAVRGNLGEKQADDSKRPVSETAQKAARAIVRRALEEAVYRQRESAVPSDLDLGSDSAVFGEQYGVFVTLNDSRGDLRGCIGNITPVGNLKDSLWHRAQDAALNDPRFEPVKMNELLLLSFEISVLTPLEPIGGPDDIVIGKHGVVMRKAGRSAVFLPQVAPEQGWNVEQMLTALSRKAGLDLQAWREGATFYVLEAQVF